MFNEKMFENVLQNQVINKNLTSKTMDGYFRCIHQLEKDCRNKDGPSAVILEKAINKLCRENKQMRKYITAVKRYEIKACITASKAVRIKNSRSSRFS